MDPDNGVELQGWQGQVVEVSGSYPNQQVTIAWDAGTLLKMKPWEMNHLGKNGYDLRQMTFPAYNLSLSSPRVSSAKSVEEKPAWGPYLKTITRDDVLDLADSRVIYKRGQGYYRDGMVSEFSAADGTISARVKGSYGDYSIEMTETKLGLKMDCSCPYEGKVCKHKVAVLLNFIATVQPTINPPMPAALPGNPLQIPNNANRETIAMLTAMAKTRQGQPAPTSPPNEILNVFRNLKHNSTFYTKSNDSIEGRGKILAIADRVTIQYIDQELANIDVISLNNKCYQVSIKNTNNTIRGMSFSCSCTHIPYDLYDKCEHMAATAYVLRLTAPKLPVVEVKQATPTDLWESRLKQALSGTKTARKSVLPRNILLFSMQERYSGSGWKLTPYTMPTSLLDSTILEDRAAVQEAISELGKNSQIKEVSYYGQPPVSLLYGTQDLGMMARMVSLANYQHSENILSFILPHLQDALLFRGDGDYYGNPFTDPILQVDATPRPLQISMVDENNCTYLGATLPDDEEDISLTAEETRIINVNPLWVMTDDRLLRVEGDAALLKGLLESREIVIPQAEKKNFISRYLPKLLDFAEVSGDAIGEREELDIAPVCRVYLREEDNTITADLAFAYASYEVPLETSWPKTAMQYDEERGNLINITRHSAEEEGAWRAMNSYGLKRDGERFVLKTKVAPVDFLLRHVTQLQAAGYEVFGEDELKGARVNRSVPKVRMTVSSGIDWFDVQTVVSYGEQDVAMSEIRRAIKKRQGYVKLPDGTLGMLPDEIIARYRQLFAMGIETETGVRMSKTQATLLELSLQDTDAEVDAEYTRRIEQLRNFSQIAQRPLPANFCGELRHYQHTGFDWLHFLHDYGFGGCLADDMGIGKTVQALVFLQSLYESGHATSASLIVMPRSLLENWAREAARFTPNLKVIIHADGDRSDDHTSFDGFQLVLTTYGVMLRDLSMFKKYPFHYLVLDEAQAIKNPASQSARAARLLTGEHRLALTGTPVENSTEELWSLFAFLNPGQLGSQEAFREQFANPIQRNQDEAAARALRTLVHPFILRRTKEQVAPELPPRTERLIYCEMTPSQRKLYLKTRDRYRDELMGLIDNGGMQQARFKVLEGLLRLRQLANDPRLVDKTYTGTSSKFEAILDAMEVLREEGHKALIFSQFTSMLSLLRTSMDERGWPYLYLDGKTKNRQELVDNFQETEEIPFFLISLKAGGTGLNLTAADYVIHIDPWWNPAVERQATDRTHRIGQERPVMVYKFIAEESVEEKILLLQEKKQALVDQLISTEGSLMKSLTRDDVAALFT